MGLETPVEEYRGLASKYSVIRLFHLRQTKYYVGTFFYLKAIKWSTSVCGLTYEISSYNEKRVCLLYAFFWVIPRRLNFICRRFGTLSVPS